MVWAVGGGHQTTYKLLLQVAEPIAVHEVGGTTASLGGLLGGGGLEWRDHRDAEGGEAGRASDGAGRRVEQYVCRPQFLTREDEHDLKLAVQPINEDDVVCWGVA